MNEFERVRRKILISSKAIDVPQDGYWVHKDTAVKTYFGADADFITDGVMGYPAWMPNCSEVKLPSGVTGFKTYNWVFEEFDNLEFTYIGFVHSKETIITGNDILIGVDLSNTSITSVGSNSFYGCYALTSITLPVGVTSLGSGCFLRCSSLTSINLPDSLTSIGAGAFDSCASLTSITLPDGLTSIESNTFYSCTSLSLVTSLPAIPPSLGSYVFLSTHANLNIKVPAQSVNAYKTAKNWKSYANKITAI